MITSFDPRTGEVLEQLAIGDVEEDVESVCVAAVEAARELATLGRAGRVRMLRAMAGALEARRGELVGAADRETGLGSSRLGGELTRASFQLRLFAEVLQDGAYLEATIDHAVPTPMGPRPDLRRILLPLGPVAVFGASNFPFAFSVPGGDTASALAAGCPVVAKVHEAHPRTSVLCREVLVDGARMAGMSTAPVGLVYGRQAAVELVKHPAIQAVGFTGSLSVGRLLFDIASSRPMPIPFYGELGALNTLTVCPEAARQRGEEIGRGLAASFTLGSGQFCTKPGVALVPAGADGATVVATLAEAVRQMPAGVLLSEHTANAYAGGSRRLRETPGVTVLAEGGARPERGWWGTPLLLRADTAAIAGPLREECFGPVLIIVEYDSADNLLATLDQFGPALTGTIHAEETGGPIAARVAELLIARVGRLVWNGYPTGLAVGWATHHGGPYPATTNALHTSVGAAAIRRWLRPVCFQDIPAWLLPAELRDDDPTGVAIPRRVDGALASPHTR